jgi:hypothetical protein
MSALPSRAMSYVRLLLQRKYQCSGQVYCASGCIDSNGGASSLRPRLLAVSHRFLHSCLCDDRMSARPLDWVLKDKTNVAEPRPDHHHVAVLLRIEASVTVRAFGLLLV